MLHHRSRTSNRAVRRGSQVAKVHTPAHGFYDSDLRLSSCSAQTSPRDARAQCRPRTPCKAWPPPTLSQPSLLAPSFCPGAALGTCQVFTVVSWMKRWVQGGRKKGRCGGRRGGSEGGRQEPFLHLASLGVSICRKETMGKLEN